MSLRALHEHWKRNEEEREETERQIVKVIGEINKWIQRYEQRSLIYLSKVDERAIWRRLGKEEWPLDIDNFDGYKLRKERKIEQMERELEFLNDLEL